MCFIALVSAMQCVIVVVFGETKIPFGCWLLWLVLCSVLSLLCLEKQRFHFGFYHVLLS